MDLVQINLSAEEMEQVIQALKERSKRRREEGDPSAETDALVARLEERQRDQRRHTP